jgi:hypothetical protein
MKLKILAEEAKPTIYYVLQIYQKQPARVGSFFEPVEAKEMESTAFDMLREVRRFLDKYKEIRVDILWEGELGSGEERIIGVEDELFLVSSHPVQKIIMGENDFRLEDIWGDAEVRA